MDGPTRAPLREEIARGNECSSSHVDGKKGTIRDTDGTSKEITRTRMRGVAFRCINGCNAHTT
eukprot:scaffold76_cov363-Pavlova_lutheri.AAC.10